MKKYKYEIYEYPDEWKINKTFEDYINEWMDRYVKELNEKYNNRILQDMTFTDNINYAFNRVVPAYVTTIPAEYVTENTAIIAN